MVECQAVARSFMAVFPTVCYSSVSTLWNPSDPACKAAIHGIAGFAKGAKLNLTNQRFGKFTAGPPSISGNAVNLSGVLPKAFPFGEGACEAGG